MLDQLLTCWARLWGHPTPEVALGRDHVCQRPTSAAMRAQRAAPEVMADIIEGRLSPEERVLWRAFVAFTRVKSDHRALGWCWQCETDAEQLLQILVAHGWRPLASPQNAWMTPGT